MCSRCRSFLIASLFRSVCVKTAFVLVASVYWFDESQRPPHSFIERGEFGRPSDRCNNPSKHRDSLFIKNTIHLIASQSRLKADSEAKRVFFFIS